MTKQSLMCLAGVLLALGCSSSKQRPAATPQTESYPESTYQPPEASSDDAPASSTIPDQRTQTGSDAPMDSPLRAEPIQGAQGMQGAQPLDQGEDEADVRISRQVRESIMADDQLSFTAKNVDIITSAGHVTLRGAVKTAAESEELERRTRATSGVREVDNQLVVSP